jgi:short-subunit dehydrogenase
VTYVIVGASAGLGRALARRFAEAGHSLVLVASDPRDLAAVAADLRIRHGVPVTAVPADVATDEGYLDRVAQAADALGGADGLLFPIGANAAGDDGSLDASAATRLWRANFLAVAAVAARFLPGLRRRPRAVIVGFGSVAAARGRGANVVYAAAKRGLESFFESLRHACAGSSVTVQLYVLGYLDTQLAFGVRTPLPKADPARLSARVLADLDRDVGVVYYPAVWRPICALLRRVPWVLYRRMTF